MSSYKPWENFYFLMLDSIAKELDKTMYLANHKNFLLGYRAFQNISVTIELTIFSDFFIISVPFLIFATYAGGKISFFDGTKSMYRAFKKPILYIAQIFFKAARKLKKC